MSELTIAPRKWFSCGSRSGPASQVWLRPDRCGYDALPDYAFGNALGNSIVDASKPRSSSLAALGKQIDEENDRSLNDWAASGLAEAANRTPTLNVELDNNPNDIILGRPTSYGSGTDVYGDGSVITYALPDQPQVGPGVDIPPTIQQASRRPSLEAEIGHALLNGLNYVNDKTQIPFLVDLGNDVQNGLDNWGAKAIASGHEELIPLLGAASGIFAAVAPQGALDLIPGGKGAKVLRTGDELGALGRVDEGLSAINKELRVVDVGSLDEFKGFSRAPDPNTVYNYDGFAFTTDEYGRGVNSAGMLSLGEGNNRFSTDRLLGYPHHPDALPGDIGFHAGADQFGFPGGKLNVFPGNAELNSAAGAYGKFEREVLRPLVNNPNNKVYAEFQRVFNPGNTTIRPDAMAVIYRVNDGPSIEKFFINNASGR